MRATFLFLAILNLYAAPDAQANEFLNRARQNYESLTPSQRAEIESAAITGRQITGTPDPRKDAGGGQPLAFLTGLSCKDWNQSAEPVRLTWLNRYLDAVDVKKNGVAYRSDKKEVLARVDGSCHAKLAQPAEAALAEAYRYYEADMITKEARALEKAAEARERLAAQKEAAAAEKLKPGNNPLLNASRESMTCRQWALNQNDVQLRQHYLHQYQKERFPESTAINTIGRRMWALCHSYPDFLVAKAADYLFGAEAARSFVTSDTVTPALVSWKQKIQYPGASLKVSAMDEMEVAGDSQTVEVPPGLHSMQYTCSTSNAKFSRTSEFFLRAKPAAEYAILTASFPADGLIAPHAMQVGDSYQLRPNFGGYAGGDSTTCGAVIYECPGRLYIDKAKNLATCEAEKHSPLKAMLSSAIWILD